MFWKKKAPCCPHLPIEQAPKDEVLLLWLDSYDCGWTCDLGWVAEDGTINEIGFGGSHQVSHYPYSHFQYLTYPKETPPW